MAGTAGLTVAVTGPTGTFGRALMPLLQQDDSVARVIGIARRPFDPAALGWTKLEYRRGDVRDAEALGAAFEGADVVVHLAFLIVGGERGDHPRDQRRGHPQHLPRGGRGRGAAVRLRLVDRGVRLPPRQPDRHGRGLADPPGGPAVLRPGEGGARAPAAPGGRRAPGDGALPAAASDRPGPDAVGGKVSIPAALAPLVRGAGAALRRLPGLPVLVPDLPLQLIHQEDVAEALRLCIVGAGPPGAYNIAADDVVTGADVARALGLRAVGFPAGPVAAAARLAARLPYLPSAAQWVEAVSHPAIMDTTKARTQLGWRPRHTAIESLRSTLEGE